MNKPPDEYRRELERQLGKRPLQLPYGEPGEERADDIRAMLKASGLRCRPEFDHKASDGHVAVIRLGCT